MATGDLTPSTPTYCEGAAAVSTHILTLSLAAVTDVLHVEPVTGREKLFLVFKVEREA